MNKLLMCATFASVAVVLAACGTKRTADAPPAQSSAAPAATAPASKTTAAAATAPAAAQTPAPAQPAAAATAVAPPPAMAEVADTGSRMSAADATAITEHHNKAREAVKSAPLAWSSKLAAYAQEWTDQLAKSCQMKHRAPNQYGENLFKGTAGKFGALDASKAWEREKSKWRGGVLTSKNWQPAGHYTQMVWRDTTAFGCGESTCSGQKIIACNYDPAGNVLGKKPY